MNDWQKRWRLIVTSDTVVDLWLCAVEKWSLCSPLNCITTRQAQDELGQVLLRATSHQVSWKAKPDFPSQAALITADELRGYKFSKWEAFRGGYRPRNSFHHWCGSQGKVGNKDLAECLIWKSYKRWGGGNWFLTWHKCNTPKKELCKGVWRFSVICHVRQKTEMW